MTRFLSATRRVSLLAVGLVVVLCLVALAIGFRTRSQQRRVLDQDGKDALLRVVHNAPDLPLRVAGNDGCPFKIIQASVKELPASDFTRLTGRATEMASVSTVPEVKLVNTSGDTITGFIIAIRDPQSQMTRGFVQQKISVPPGGDYVIKRDHFVDPDKVTVADAAGRSQQKLIRPKMDAEKYWLPFAPRSDIFITVGRVTFANGTNWMIKQGDDIR
jgi:hypothetical protein